jgi:hypothetical protein
VQADVVLPRASTGGGTYLNLATRRVGNADYRLKLWVRPAGEVEVLIVRVVDGVETVLGGRTLPDGYVPGSTLTLRLDVSGSGTTTLRAKVWTAGRAEPDAWTVSAADTEARLQVPGALYLQEYVSGSATAPSTLRLDNLWIGPSGTVPEQR